MIRLITSLFICTLLCNCVATLKNPNDNKHIDSSASIDNDTGVVLMIEKEF